MLRSWQGGHVRALARAHCRLTIVDCRLKAPVSILAAITNAFPLWVLIAGVLALQSGPVHKVGNASFRYPAAHPEPVEG